MASQGPSPAELESHSNAEDSILTYLTTSISSLRKEADFLFYRYKAAGIKYHAMPFAVRDSKNSRDGIIDMFEEAFSLTTDDRLAAVVVDTFGNLIYCIVEAKKALNGTNQVVEAADNFVFDALILAENLEEKISATESAVADVVAMKNRMKREGKL